MRCSNLALICLLIAVVLVLAATPSSGLRVLYPEELRRNYTTPEFKWLVSPHPVEGPLVIFNDLPRIEDMRGKIVLLKTNLTGPVRLAGIRNEIAFNILASYGAAGIIYTNPVTQDGGASESLLFHPEIGRNISVPVVEIGYKFGAELASIVPQNDTMIVRLDIGDYNIWREIRAGAGITSFMVIFGVWTGICAAFALTHLIGFVHQSGVQFNIAQITLLIEFITNLFRLIYLALDPIYAGRVFLAHQAHMMISISWPFTVMTTMLITLYWVELLNLNKVVMPVFLSSMKWPFLGASIVILALELATSISRATSIGPVGTLTMIAGIIYALIVVSTTLFFLIVGSRTLKQLSQGEKIGAKSAASKRILKKTTKLVMASGVFGLIWIIGTLLAVIPQIFWDYRGFHITWAFVFSGLCGTSLAKVLSFSPKRFNLRSPRGTGNNSATSITAGTLSGSHGTSTDTPTSRSV